MHGRGDSPGHCPAIDDGCHAEAGSHPNSHLYSHADTLVRANEDPDQYAYGQSHLNGNADAHTYPDPTAHPHSDGHADPYSHAYANAYSYADSHSDRHPDSC